MAGRPSTDLVRGKRPFGSSQIDSMPDAHSIDAATFPAAINGTLRMAPTLHRYETKIEKGDPLWIYKPQIPFLIFGEESQVLLNLQLLNSNLIKNDVDARRAMTIEEQEDDEGGRGLFSGYPKTVDELLENIPPFGAFGSGSSSDEAAAVAVVGQLTSEITRVPKFWTGLKKGDRVGFRVGLVNLDHRPIQSPLGDVIDQEPLSEPVLQLTPFVKRNGTALHGTGDMNDYKNSLDFREKRSVQQYEVAVNALGIPTHSKVGDPVLRSFIARGEGKYIHFGTVIRSRGPDPSHEEIEEALRSLPARTRLQSTSSCDIALVADQLLNTW